MNMKRFDQGYITSAYGKKRFLQQALTLALSIKRFDPDRQCCLITDHHLAEEAFGYQEKGYFQDIFIFDDNLLQGFKGKLIGYQVTPYNRTMFIDSDCLVVQNVDHLWKHLDSLDFCIQGEVLSTGSYAGLDIQDYIRLLNIPFLPVFNGGCFSWNKKGENILIRALEILANSRAFSLPKGAYGYDDDQPALGIAMAEKGIKPLPNSLNLHFSYYHGTNLLLSLREGSCRFQKGSDWVEPAVFHYNSLAGPDSYRSNSRKILESEISFLRKMYNMENQVWPKPNFREVLSLLKNSQWRLRDSR